jgi:formylglycine-generating enzyme required for sulfatase activity
MLIPAGEFVMGASRTEKWHLCVDQHPVRITRPFYMSAYEITLRQFTIFYRATNYETRRAKQGRRGTAIAKTGNGKLILAGDSLGATPWDWGHLDQTDEHPVVNVSWHDAVAFCKWLSEKEGRHYRLPTEAEWEYACRARTTTVFYNSNDEEGLINVGNVSDIKVEERVDEMIKEPKFSLHGSDGYALTAPVGKFTPNPFGLYDMHGNVSEWCSDWFSDEYYKNSRVNDPKGPSIGESRVHRGGEWLNPWIFARSAHRTANWPSCRFDTLGFRIVCEEEAR